MLILELQCRRAAIELRTRIFWLNEQFGMYYFQPVHARGLEGHRSLLPTAIHRARGVATRQHAGPLRGRLVADVSQP